MTEQETDRLILEIATPAGRLYHETVSGVNVPASQGRMGILYNHAPIMTTLECGVLEYTQGDEKHRFAIGDGLLDVQNNLVLVLVDTAERDDEIDRKRAQEAYARAKERLLEPDKGVDMLRARAAMKRALARINASKRK